MSLLLYTAHTHTTTVLQPLYRCTFVSWHLQLRTGSASAKFYCLHALGDGNQHIWITGKMLEFSSVLSSICLHTFCFPICLALFRRRDVGMLSA